MSAFAGSGSLVRLALRRDRILLVAFIVVLVLIAAVSAAATVDLYPSLSSRVEAAYAINRSQALVALYGRVYDPSSAGALAMIKTGSLGAVFVAMLSVVLVVRHTRADEEAGRLELAGATAMGRQAPLVAALLTAVVANLVLAVVTAGALAATGLPIDGSIAFGLAWAGVGLAFAAIAALVAQVTTSARTATSLAAAILAVVYILRAAGDSASEGGPRWLSWLSPIGWAQQFRPYAGNRWWVLLITLGFAVVAAGIAFALAARRDLGGGLLPTRGGPASASGRLRSPLARAGRGRRGGGRGGGRGSASGLLRSPLALAWRLHRGALLGWGVGFAVVGALLGGMASNVGDFLNNPSARDFITTLGGEKALSDAFLALELGFAGVIASAYGIQVVMRLRSEEAEQHAEPVLATAVGRIRWAASHILVALAGTTLLMVLVGAGAGLAHGAQTGHMNEAGPVFTAALVQLPAVWVLTAIVVAAFGLAPRFVAFGWVALAGFLLLGELGPLLDLDQRVMDLSPFAHTPRLPGGTFSATPLVVLTAVAALLGAAGLAAFRRRDIGST